ncbi:MAG: hypothetical protein ACREJ4_13550, partial [Candidatus Methylomirabilaceae bacterium]
PEALLELRRDLVRMIRSTSGHASGGRQRDWLGLWVGVTTIEALELLSPDSVLVRFMQSSYIDAGELSDSVSRFNRVRVLGVVVVDSDRSAYVLVNYGCPDLAEGSGGDIGVMTVRRTRFGWRSMLDGGLLFDNGALLAPF